MVETVLFIEINGRKHYMRIFKLQFVECTVGVLLVVLTPLYTPFYCSFATKTTEP